MNQASANPPAIPTPAPTSICTVNSSSPLPTALHPLADPAARRLASSAMPTGSLAPDSPSRSTPERPATSRRPSTENTTAGSVGASAVPSSRAARQSKPNSTLARNATPPAVAKVPATPIQVTEAAADRNRRQPHLREDVRDDGRGDEEDRRCRHPYPRTEAVGEHRHDDGGTDDADNSAEPDDPFHPLIISHARACHLSVLSAHTSVHKITAWTQGLTRIRQRANNSPVARCGTRCRTRHSRRSASGRVKIIS